MRYSSRGRLTRRLITRNVSTNRSHSQWLAIHESSSKNDQVYYLEITIWPPFVSIYHFSSAFSFLFHPLFFSFFILLRFSLFFSSLSLTHTHIHTLKLMKSKQYPYLSQYVLGRCLAFVTAVLCELWHLSLRRPSPQVFAGWWDKVYCLVPKVP